MSTTYNRNIDLLKGVAILLVVVGHSFYFSFIAHESAIAFKALASIHNICPYSLSYRGICQDIKTQALRT